MLINHGSRLMRTLNHTSCHYYICASVPLLAKWGYNSPLFSGPLNETKFLTFLILITHTINCIHELLIEMETGSWYTLNQEQILQIGPLPQHWLCNQVICLQSCA